MLMMSNMCFPGGHFGLMFWAEDNVREIRLQMDGPELLKLRLTVWSTATHNSWNDLCTFWINNMFISDVLQN